MIVTFDAELWIWDARRGDSWTFVTLPQEPSEDIRHLTAGPRRGFGSVRVRATIGDTTWATSIFPESGGGAYVLFLDNNVTIVNGSPRWPTRTCLNSAGPGDVILTNRTANNIAGANRARSTMLPRISTARFA